MKDSLRVAAWEVAKMLRNKSFIISILLAPIIMAAFSLLPALMGRVEATRDFRLFVIDNLGIYDSLANQAAGQNIVFERHIGTIETLQTKILGRNNSGYLLLDDSVLAERQATIVLGGDGMPGLGFFNEVLRDLLRQEVLRRQGLSPDTIMLALAPFSVGVVSLAQGDDQMRQIIPLAFSGIILFSVYITGMMILQSAMVEKKDRMAEIILSSISAESLMQGKLLGYSALGLFQTIPYLVFGGVVAHFSWGIPVLIYLWSPQLPLLLFFAVAGYFFYASVLVALGATIDDLATAGNFQSFIMMIPILPLLFIQPIMVNPNGVIAVFGSYFPLTAAGVMLMRLAMSTTMTMLDILLPSLVLLLALWQTSKFSGKIFRMGMLMYGKNATPSEIWKWLRH